jgi:hypothetical protein
LCGEALIQVLFITSRGHVRVVREWWSNGRSSLSKHVIAPSGNFDPYLLAQPTQNIPQLKSNLNSATICWVLDAQTSCIAIPYVFPKKASYNSLKNLFKG